MRNVAHVEDDKELVCYVHISARLYVQLVKSNEGGVLVLKGSE